jgi:hypothetical protein
MVLGHSIVRQFDEFCQSNSLQIARCSEVSICGIGGRTVDKIMRYNLGKVSEFQPDSCILLIGDNDVKFDSSAEEISFKILALVSVLHNRLQVTSVIVCQLLPRFPNCRDWVHYNVVASRINSILQQELYNGYPYARFRLHDGKFSFPDPTRVQFEEEMFRCRKNKFVRDGIHLSGAGLYY